MNNYLFLLFFISSLTSCTAQTNEIIKKNISYQGGKDKIDAIHSVSAKGTVEIKAFNITIPFHLITKGNKMRFAQEAVEQGMDLNPGIIRTITDKAYTIIDERPMNRGFHYKELPSRGLELWQETKFLFPFTTSFYLKNNRQFMHESTANGAIILTTQTKSGEKTTLYFDSETGALERHDFKDYHFQLGEVNVSRTYASYSEKDGLKYPSKWIDNRDGLELIYTVNSIEFNEVSDTEFDLPNRKKTKPLSSEQLNTITSSYIAALEKESPFTEVIEKLKKELSNRVQKGNYNNITSHNSFAQKLSDDIVKITGDYHFGIIYNPELFKELSIPEQEDTNDDTIAFKEKVKAHEKSNNFFFKETGLKQDYFYFHLTEFGALENVKDYFDSLMAKAAKSKGLIIDLRDNSGGRGDFAHYMLSYFLPENALLYTNVTKGKEKKIYTVNTKAIDSHRTMPIYILVNKRTASAGELVPYVLQNFGRATVIGETTFGMAHPSIDVPLKSGFVGFVPVAYAKHKKTNTDWEGVGVVPDIKCNSDKVWIVLNKRLSTVLKNNNQD